MAEFSLPGGEARSVSDRRRAVGARGEELVAAWYRAAGYDVLARNWRCREGELDLVAGRPRLVVFCEVKTRSSVAFGLPAEAVTPAKQRRLRTLAARWLRERSAPVAAEVRFDVASVIGDRIEVLENAF